MPLVARILGVIPRVFGYLEIWPPAFETYALVVPAFFDMPRCDAGLGLGPARRSLVAYASSRGHGCMYCAAHSAALGDVFRGSRRHLKLNAAATDGTECKLEDPEQRALVRYGLAVAKVPGRVAPGVLQELRAHVSPRQLESVALVAATMGLLNRCLDSLGMVLEGPLLDLANQQLGNSGFEPSAVYDARFDSELLEADHEAPTPRLGPIGVIRHLGGALRFEARALAALPGSRRALDELVERRLGFVPYYLRRFDSARVRRTLAHLLLERLLHTRGARSPALRSAMCLIAAQASGNATLAAHFGYWGAREAGMDRMLGILKSDRASAPDGLAVSFAQSACQVPLRLDKALVDRLTSSFAPPVLIELVLTVSIYSALHRITLTFPCERLEDPVLEFRLQERALWDLAAERARA